MTRKPLRPLLSSRALSTQAHSAALSLKKFEREVCPLLVFRNLLSATSAELVVNQDRKKLEKFGPKTSVAYALLQSNATIHITKERRGDEVRSGPENMKRCQNEKLQRKKKRIP